MTQRTYKQGDIFVKGDEYILIGEDLANCIKEVNYYRGKIMDNSRSMLGPTVTFDLEFEDKGEFIERLEEEYDEASKEQVKAVNNMLTKFSNITKGNW